MIPYGKQTISEADIQAVISVMKSDFLTTGPMVEQFEQALCKYLGVKHAVAIANGTAALHAACFAAGIGIGDEVITTPITFAASANCVLYSGGTPVFADIDPATWNISPESIREKITERTKAIIPVHFTGQPCDMSVVLEIAKEYNLLVIEDGAHSLGAEYKNNLIGCIGDMMTLSFHPVKHITTGEGGAIVTNDDELAKKLRSFRTHGIVRGEQMQGHYDEPWFYEQQSLGFNYRITDIQCALGISQMSGLPGFLERRREIANRYNEAFANLSGLRIPTQLEDTNSAWHIYVICLDLEKLTANRKEIFIKLKEKGIGVNVHYIPVYYHPYYREMGYDLGLCPVAEDLYERIITIPLYPSMSDNEVNEVIAVVREVITAHIRV